MTIEVKEDYYLVVKDNREYRLHKSNTFFLKPIEKCTRFFKDYTREFKYESPIFIQGNFEFTDKNNDVIKSSIKVVNKLTSRNAIGTFRDAWSLALRPNTIYVLC